MQYALPLFVAKFRADQRKGYLNTLKKARAIQREANAIYKDRLVTQVKIPTIRELEKMNYTDAVKLMGDLRKINRPGDLVKKVRGQGYAASDYEVKRARRMAKEAEERKAELRERLTPEEEAVYMGSEYVTNLQPKKYDFEKSYKQADFDRIVRRLERETSEKRRQEQQDLFLTNYYNGIISVFGDMNPEEIDDLFRRLSDISPEDFEYYVGTNELLSLDFVYDTATVLQSRFDSFISAWNDVLS